MRPAGRDGPAAGPDQTDPRGSSTMGGNGAFGPRRGQEAVRRVSGTTRIRIADPRPDQNRWSLTQEVENVQILLSKVSEVELR